MFTGVEFVDGRFFHPLVLRLGPVWHCVFVHGITVGVAGHFEDFHAFLSFAFACGFPADGAGSFRYSKGGIERRCARLSAFSQQRRATLLKTMSIREKDFCSPMNFSGVFWPRCLFISHVVSRCEEPVYFAVLKAFPDEVPLVSAKRDDWTWATVRARRRKGLGHRTKLKPFLVYLAPRREQLTNVIRLLLVDYVFRRIFFHLLEASVHPTMLNDCFRKKLLFGSFLKILSARL